MIELRPLPARALAERSAPSPQDGVDPRAALVLALLGTRDPAELPPLADLIAAVAVWAGYIVLLAVKRVRGLTGRRLSLSAVVLFVLSLAVFAFV